jgi:hypothetical protein
MHRAAPRRRRPPLTVVAVVLLVLAGSAVVLGWRGRGGGEPPRLVAERSLVAPRPEVRAAALLRRWDDARAAAWSAGDHDGLALLYVAGSATGRRDAAMLRAWSRRGVRVEGLRTQVVRVRVVAHRPGRYDLEVVDRVVAGTVVGTGPSRPLPRDGPSTRRVVLVDAGGAWVVGEVSRVPAPARLSAGPSAAPP